MATFMVLESYPTLVDPQAACLEVVARDPANPGRKRATQLPRVALRPETAPFGLRPQMVHFFGDAAEAADCTTLVAYSGPGVLRYRAYLTRSGWEVIEVPPDMVGEVENRPGLRLVFGDAGHYTEFLAAWQDLLAAQGAADDNAVLEAAGRMHRHRPVDAVRTPVVGRPGGGR